MFDVCIIGAGVVGMNIARELSRYQLQICVLEKQDDVGCGCSKSNSGIVHGGYSDEPGTLKAEVCVAGNRMYAQLERELNFGYRKTGSVVLAFQDEDIEKLHELYVKGKKNGVQGLAILTGDKVREIEPHLSKEVKAALYCENAGVTSPYEFVIALAENAVANGVDLRLNNEVIDIQAIDGEFNIITRQGAIKAKYVINSAGIYCDRIANMVGVDKYKITPRRGQYVVLNKDQNHLVKSVIFQVPTKMGKGILVTTTYHGNLMIGPNAEEIGDKEDVSTDEKTLEHIVSEARKSVPGFDMKKALTSFAGNRPIANIKDFIIEESIPGFINLIGIDSPGLTSSPAIALKVTAKLVKTGLIMQKKSSFKPYRQAIIKKKTVAFQGDVNSTEPETHIICRCEQVTEAEIIDSLHRGISIQSIDAVKRRTRAGMGNCQGSFCGSRVQKLVAEELKIPLEQVTKAGPSSSSLAQRAKRGDLLKM